MTDTNPTSNETLRADIECRVRKWFTEPVLDAVIQALPDQVERITRYGSGYNVALTHIEAILTEAKSPSPGGEKESV
jgi:hypothetical protein